MLHYPIKTSSNLILFLILLFSLSAPAFADDIAVTATVDKTETTLEDLISLTVTVSGTQNSPTPQLPPLPDFRVQSMGTSSSVQIVNLKMKASVSFNYRLTPIKTGKFAIQPINVVIDGKKYATEPIALNIKEPSAVIDNNAPIFAQSSVSNDKPYVNEQVTLTVKLLRRVDIRNVNLNASYDNFRKEDLGKEKEYAQVINGINYSVLELSVALFPAKAGTFEIPPAVIDLDVLHRTQDSRPSRDPFAHFFDDSFLFGGRVQSEHKTLRTKPIVLKVQPLPEAGRPQNFSNLVGRFTITSALGKENLDVGDSSTLTIVVSGKGNVKDIPEPNHDLQDVFKVYPDQPEFKQEIDGGQISGKKTFKFALVPLQEGKAMIPSISLSYFDPYNKKYVNTQTNPLSIQVKPSSIKESLNTAEGERPKQKQETIKVVGKDILPIHTHISDFNDQRFTQSKIALYIGYLIFPALLFFASAYYLNFKRRLQFDVAWSRNRTAYKIARKKLDAVATSHISDTKDFVKELSKILREYIGDKLNLQGTAFTSVEMAEKMKERNYKENIVQSVAHLLEKYESLQYAPTQVNGDMPTTLANESSNIIEQIEKQP